MENLELTQEWDKVFPKSNKVDHQKITFHNRYGITLAADMYTPKNAAGKLSAIAVSGPFGAVKEQSSGLYAQTMAEFGFLTIAFDPSFTGESGGSPRYVASPDINTEDFCAAVDFLSAQEPGQILHLVHHGQIALVLGSHHHRAKDTGQRQDYGGSHIGGEQPDQGGHATHHQGTNQCLKELLFPKAGEQLRFRLHAQRDIQLQILVHSHLLCVVI